MELRLPLEMSPGREAACRAVFGTWGFFPNDARKNCPFVLTSFTGWSSERCPGIGFLPRAATSFTDPYAIEAIRLVLGNLQSAYHEPENAEARFNMHNASALAGMAFTNASLGLVHSLAHKIGGEFGVTHGLANAILLPYIIRFNRQFSDKYSQVEKLLGINDLPSAIEALNKELNIPCCFAQCDEVEFSESKFLDVLERMSQNAHADPCTWTNPGKPTVSDVKALYEAAYYGTADCCQ